MIMMNKKTYITLLVLFTMSVNYAMEKKSILKGNIIHASDIPIIKKLGLSTNRQVYAHPSKIVFELWNKLPIPIFFRISKDKDWPAFDQEKTYKLDPEEILSLAREDFDIQ